MEASVIAAGGTLQGAVLHPKIYVNDAALVTDVQPFILEDRVMAPVRAISEAIGCKVEWFERDPLSYVYAGGIVIIWKMGLGTH